jgi:hypothetical protein
VAALVIHVGVAEAVAAIIPAGARFTPESLAPITSHREEHRDEQGSKTKQSRGQETETGETESRRGGEHVVIPGPIGRFCERQKQEEVVAQPVSDEWAAL